MYGCMYVCPCACLQSRLLVFLPQLFKLRLVKPGCSPRRCDEDILIVAQHRLPRPVERPSDGQPVIDDAKLVVHVLVAARGLGVDPHFDACRREREREREARHGIGARSIGLFDYTLEMMSNRA